MVADDEHRVEAADALAHRFGAGHLGRHHLPDRRHRRTPPATFELWAVDRNKQSVIWKKPLGSGNRAGRKQNVSSPSPVTDGRTVWVMTGTGIIKAFDFAGNEKQNAAAITSIDRQTDRLEGHRDRASARSSRCSAFGTALP